MKKRFILGIAIAFCGLSLTGMQCGPTETKETNRITSSFAGQKFLDGDTITLAWSKPITNPVIEYNYHKTGSSSWTVITKTIPVGSQEIKVILPTTSFSDSFQLRITDPSGTEPVVTSDYFSVKFILITAPASNASHKMGDVVTIRWRADETKFSSYRLMLSVDGGKSYDDMLTTSIATSARSYDWTIGSETRMENNGIFSMHFKDKTL